MSLIALIIILAIVGLVVWAILKYVPLPQAFRTLIVIVAIVGSILFALSAFGFNFGSLALPRTRG